jgi:hypothetical protein
LTKSIYMSIRKNSRNLSKLVANTVKTLFSWIAIFLFGVFIRVALPLRITLRLIRLLYSIIQACIFLFLIDLKNLYTNVLKFIFYDIIKLGYRISTWAILIIFLNNIDKVAMFLSTSAPLFQSTSIVENRIDTYLPLLQFSTQLIPILGIVYLIIDFGGLYYSTSVSKKFSTHPIISLCIRSFF